MTVRPQRIALSIIVAVAILALAAAGGEPAGVHGSAPPDPYVHDQVVVRLHDADDLADVNDDFGTSTLDEFEMLGGTVYLLETPSGEDSADVAADLSLDARVKWAEPNILHGLAIDDGDQAQSAGGTETVAQSAGFDPLAGLLADGGLGLNAAGPSPSQLDSSGSPEDDCPMRTDYGSYACSGTFDVESLDDLADYVASDYGRNGGSYYKHLDIEEDLSIPGGTLVIESPCEIEIDDGVKLTADALHIDGQAGVDGDDLGYEIDAGLACITSSAGEADTGEHAVINASTLTLWGRYEAEIEIGAIVNVENQLTILAEANDASIEHSASVSAGAITIKADRHAYIDHDATVTADGLILLHSTGPAGEAEVRYDADVTAGALSLASRLQAQLDNNATVDVDGTLTIVSFGDDAEIDAGVTLTVSGDMNLSGGDQAKIAGGASVSVARTLHMEALTPDKCSLSSSAIVSYTDMSGNCADSIGGVHASPYRSYRWDSLGPDPYYNQPSLRLVGVAALDGHAHDFATGAGVRVAIIDTGFEDHQLMGAVHADSFDYLDYDADVSDVLDGQDNDGDGVVDEAAGHGTFVAGIINLVAPDAEISMYRVLNSDGLGMTFRVANAIVKATDHGNKVINLSLIMPQQSQVLYDAIQYATAEDVLVIGAAGNGATDVPLYPNAYPCVFGVTSIGDAKLKSVFANWGTTVDIAAPGENVYSTFLDLDGGSTPADGEYAFWDGTSIAAPFITGQAALIVEERQQLSPHEIASLVVNTAQPIDDVNLPYAGGMGGGLADVYASVAWLNTHNPSTPISPSALLSCAPY